MGGATAEPRPLLTPVSFQAIACKRSKCTASLAPSSPLFEKAVCFLGPQSSALVGAAEKFLLQIAVSGLELAVFLCLHLIL